MKQRFNLLKSVAVAATMLSALWCGAEIPLAKNGTACAEIVTGGDTTPAIVHAANELQLALKQLSGAELPIVAAPAGAEYRIVLSYAPEALAKFPEDAATLKGNDGYAVRTNGNAVYILGSRPKGVLNGVYRMLMRNCDIVWARPDEKLATFTIPAADLTLRETDYRDIPAFQVRGWQVSYPIPLPDLVWNIRNCATWTHANPGNPTVVRMQRELGIEQEGFYAHNIVRRFMRRDLYWEKHPEFYSMVNGERIDPKVISGIATPAQLCFTNREMVKEFLKRFDEEIAKDPNHQVYAICLEDNQNACRCPECSKPIELPDGTRLELGAPNFDSTRFYMFLNEVARHLKEVAPGKRITTFAYIFAEAPPAVPLEDNMQIILCPCYKDLRYPVDAPKNRVSREHQDEWAKRGVKAVLYEYYGLAGDYPRPIDRIVAADLKYAKKLGNIVGMHSEILQDNEKESYKYRHTMPSRVFWDVNAMYIWVGTQLMWDPDQDVEALRDKFLKVVYGAAAPDMKEYFSLTEKSWYSEFPVADYHTHTILSWLALSDNGLTEKCRAALERAKSRDLDPRRREMVERVYRVFEAKRTTLKDCEAMRQVWQKLDGAPTAAYNLLTSPSWSFWRRTHGEGGRDPRIPGGSRECCYIRDSDNACYLQEHKLEAGELYVVRCRVRLEDPVRSEAGISIRFKYKNGAWEHGHDLKFPNGKLKPNEWGVITAFFRVPEGVETLSLQLGVENSYGKVWFDRPELVKVGFDADGGAVPLKRKLSPIELAARKFWRALDAGKAPADNLITSPRWIFWKRNDGETGKDRNGIYIEDAGEACLRQELILKPGKRYAVRCRVKAQHPDRSDARITARWQTVEGKFWGGNDVAFAPEDKVSADRWTVISGCFTVPARSPRLSLQLGVSECKGKVWFDKVELYLLPDDDAPDGEAVESPAPDDDPDARIWRALDSGAVPAKNLITSTRWPFWKRSTGSTGTDPAAGSPQCRYIMDSEEACLRQELILKPGRRYALRCRVKMENPDRSDARISARWQTVEGKFWGGHDAVFTPRGKIVPGEWADIRGIVTVPKRSPRISFQLGVSRCEGKVWFDRMELYLLDDAATSDAASRSGSEPDAGNFRGKNLLTSPRWIFWKRNTGSSGAAPNVAGGSPQCRYIADADEACLRQELILKPGRRYAMRCRVMMENPDRGKIGLSARWQTAGGKFWGGHDASFAPQDKIVPGKWTRIGGIVTVPARSPRLAYMLSATDIDGKVWFDRMELYLIDDAN